MARRNTIHQAGFLKVTTMPNMSKPTEMPASKRTPFDLTTNELLKKLCTKGPDGCNADCDNLDKCMYGQAWKESEMRLSVRAEITLNNRDKIVRYFTGMYAAMVWAERHRGHYTEFKAEQVKPRSGKGKSKEGK